MRRLFLYLFFLIVIVPAVSGQNVIVTSSFDSARIFIGDQIKFKIEVDKPAGIKLMLPSLKDTLCKNIEIISGPVTDSLAGKDGRTIIIAKYLITSFDSGTYRIPPVFAEIKNAGGIKRFFSDYSDLKVQRVNIAPADTTAKIYDIIDPYKAPVTVGEIVPWVLLVLIAGALVWFAIRYFRNHKKITVGVEEVVVQDPAHIIAFRELEKLKQDELWQKGEIKKYYTKLTEILRQYLENRYRVYSLELTTQETLDALVKTGFKKDGTYNQLKTVLTGADLVKFAKYKPESSENEAHFQNSWDFVGTTLEADTIQSPADILKDKKKEGGR